MLDQSYANYPAPPAQFGVTPVRMTKRLTVRKRVASACSQCKKSRMRCDDLRPCKRCFRSGKQNICLPSPEFLNGIEQHTSSNTSSMYSMNSALFVGETLNLFNSNQVESALVSPPQLMFPSFNSFVQPQVHAENHNFFNSGPVHDRSVFGAFSSSAQLAQIRASQATLNPAAISFESMLSGRPQIPQQPQILPIHGDAAGSLGNLIAQKQDEIRALLGHMQPSSALDSLLLSAMLTSPSSAQSSRISAALEAVAAVATAASLPAGLAKSGGGGGGGGAASGPPLGSVGSVSLPPLPPLWTLSNR